MSWAPAAGVMKRDCCVLAPDLRGHGLTSSTDTDKDTGNATTRRGDHGDDDHSSEGDSDDGSSRDGAGALMSLESLAEDVTSLLVEIFTRGLLSQPRQQQDQPCLQQQPPIMDSNANSSKTPASCGSISNNERSDPTRGSAAATTVGDLEDTNERGGGGGGSSCCSASHAPAVRDSSPATSPEILAAEPVKLLLVGHSLGGSIAVRVAGAAEELQRRCRGAAEVAGLVAVDVVEGTALASLDDMPEVSTRSDIMSVAERRPNTIERAKRNDLVT